MITELQLALGTCMTLGIGVGASPDTAPFQATGFKVGEVTDSTAIVWTRLTRNEKRNPASAPMVELIYLDGQAGLRKPVIGVEYPEGLTVDDIRDSAPGTDGLVRVSYKPSDSDSWQQTEWKEVDAHRDYTHQFGLSRLDANTEYALRVESRRGDNRGQTLEGGFKTAPALDDPERVVFTVSTGQAYRDTDHADGFRIYASMRKLDPSFFVHTGDILYYDRLAKTPALARYHWQRTCGLPTNVEFHKNVGSYFIKDDHDTWVNDCWPTMKARSMFQFTFEQGLAIFREQVPMGALTYRTRRWGKDLQVWMVEGRDYRSANNMPDGPEKTIWGAKQKAWFKRTVLESDATFKVLISPTPVVGPDRNNKHDNHANAAFASEGEELRGFISKQENLVVVCGDRHWQYMSVDPETGVREYSCGPASNKHAGGWRQSDYRSDYHRFLKVAGGFLSATVERQDGDPSLTFRYHSVDGEVRYEDRLTAR